METHFETTCSASAVGYCGGGCEDAIRIRKDARWFITVGHPGFNSAANNRDGYRNYSDAKRALNRYARKERVTRLGARPATPLTQKKEASLESEMVIWLQRQAPAGNWVNDTGFPTSFEGGRKAAIETANRHAQTYTEKTRIVETYFRVL